MGTMTGWLWPRDLCLFQTEFHLLLRPPPLPNQNKVQMNAFTIKDVKGKTHLQNPSLKRFGVWQRFFTGRTKPDMLGSAQGESFSNRPAKPDILSTGVGFFWRAL